jgi:hypothetical protein
VSNYTGIEINEQAANFASSINPKVTIYFGDILNLTKTKLNKQWYDIVFSLSCIDWNVQFEAMLATAWSHVIPGGHLVATFRLTLDNDSLDPRKSYQYINYHGKREGETAPYIVLSARGLIDTLLKLSPQEIAAFGYWGKPSLTAVTPYKNLCFTAISIQKKTAEDETPSLLSLHLPDDILMTINKQAKVRFW